MTFTVGQKVRGRWQMVNGLHEWFNGTITRVNLRTCTVVFDDGDVEKCKPFVEIRAIKPRLNKTAAREKKRRETLLLPPYFKNDFVKSFKFVGDRIVKLRFYDKPSVFVRMSELIL